MTTSLGPWTVRAAHPTLGETCGVVDAAGTWVALVHPINGQAQDAAVVRARADLIAAAPTLLAAARAAQNALDILMGDLDSDDDESPQMLAMQALTSAILSAEGRQA